LNVAGGVFFCIIHQVLYLQYRIQMDGRTQLFCALRPEYITIIWPYVTAPMDPVKLCAANSEVTNFTSMHQITLDSAMLLLLLLSPPQSMMRKMIQNYDC
jgi:hypothetical protein